MEIMNPYKMMSAFVESAPIDKYIKYKNGFDYLPWSIAYHYVKNVFPSCRVIKEEFMNKDGVLVPYMIDAQGHAFVKCTVVWEQFETSEVFPITDFRNQAIKNPTSKDVDNSMQRCMTKCIAMFCGLGLKLWHKEDLIDAVGVDSSAQQTASGSDPAGTESKLSMSDSISTIKNDFNTREASDKPAGSHTPAKKAEIPLHKLVELAPDMESLVKLFNQNKDKLTSIDRDLFTARRKELEAK